MAQLLNRLELLQGIGEVGTADPQLVVAGNEQHPVETGHQAFQQLLQPVQAVSGVAGNDQGIQAVTAPGKFHQRIVVFLIIDMNVGNRPDPAWYHCC